MATSTPVEVRDPQKPASGVRRRTVRAIKVYWPVSSQTLASLAAGRTEALIHDESFAAFIQVLETSPKIGDFGMYTDVFEVGIGVEGFTTGKGATPALGAVGDRTLSPTLMVTAHVDNSVSENELLQVLGQIMAAHPWEVPVIELSGPVELITRG